jgi:ribonuclease P protein component
VEPSARSDRRPMRLWPVRPEEPLSLGSAEGANVCLVAFPPLAVHLSVLHRWRSEPWSSTLSHYAVGCLADACRCAGRARWGHIGGHARQAAPLACGLADLTQEAMSETPFPTAQPPAREKTRVPPPHVDSRWKGRPEGPPPEGAAPPGSLRCNNLRRSGFRALRTAATVRSGPLTVSWVALPGQPQPVMAFAIPKRVGNAVVRNRLRRQLREAARRFLDLPEGAYLVRAQPLAAALDFQALLAHLGWAATGATRLGAGEKAPKAATPTSRDGATLAATPSRPRRRAEVALDKGPHGTPSQRPTQGPASRQGTRAVAVEASTARCGP